MDPLELAKIQNCQLTFSTPYGKETLKDLEDEFFERTSFNADPVKMGFLEGQRHVILTIRHRMRLQPDAQSATGNEQE